MVLKIFRQFYLLFQSRGRLPLISIILFMAFFDLPLALSMGRCEGELIESVRWISPSRQVKKKLDLVEQLPGGHRIEAEGTELVFYRSNNSVALETNLGGVQHLDRIDLEFKNHRRSYFLARNPEGQVVVIEVQEGQVKKFKYQEVSPALLRALASRIEFPIFGKIRIIRVENDNGAGWTNFTYSFDAVMKTVQINQTLVEKDVARLKEKLGTQHAQDLVGKEFVALWPAAESAGGVLAYSQDNYLGDSSGAGSMSYGDWHRHRHRLKQTTQLSLKGLSELPGNYNVEVTEDGNLQFSALVGDPSIVTHLDNINTVKRFDFQQNGSLTYFVVANSKTAQIVKLHDRNETENTYEENYEDTLLEVYPLDKAPRELINALSLSSTHPLATDLRVGTVYPVDKNSFKIYYSYPVVQGSYENVIEINRQQMSRVLEKLNLSRPKDLVSKPIRVFKPQSGGIEAFFQNP